jgi:hypothetical protein
MAMRSRTWTGTRPKLISGFSRKPGTRNPFGPLALHANNGHCLHTDQRCIHPHDAQLMLAFPRALTSFCGHTLDTNCLYSHSWALRSTDVRAYTSTSMEFSS